MQNAITHLAIIMDGNGRWAQKRGLPRIKGHDAGAATAREIVKASKLRGIEFITLYAFSSENWKRPPDEVEGLFNLLERFIDQEVHQLNENGVRIHIIGDITQLNPRLQQKIGHTLTMTTPNNGIHLSLALNYGGRNEIIRAVRKLVAQGLSEQQISEEAFAKQLDTAFMPDPDLLIRTGGESRISNYLLWQLAYTEMYFTDILWPDFNTQALDEALAWFAKRQRRFGMTGEQIEGGSPS